MPNPNEPLRPPPADAPLKVEYASPPRAEPSRAAAWAVVAAITLTSCAVTFGLVFWSMGRLRAARQPAPLPLPGALRATPIPFPQVTPGWNPPAPAPLATGRAELARCATHLQ